MAFHRRIEFEEKSTHFTAKAWRSQKLDKWNAGIVEYWGKGQEKKFDHYSIIPI